MNDTKKQTAVEWLLGFIEPSLTTEQKQFFSTVIERALSMEREKIEEAKTEGYKLAKEIYKIQ
jgi:hypothetical protein